jgi:hypothetical protein
MTTPQITIYDAKTGETITRDFNADELAQLELDKKQAQLDAQAREARQAARQAVLDKLGLTADEANALLG